MSSKPICWFSLIALLALFSSTYAILRDQSAQAQSPEDAASSLKQAAAADRARAADARNQAQQWQEMARKARQRAVTSSGTMKQVWEQSATNDDAEAKRLNAEADELERKARDAEQKGEAAASGGQTTPEPAAQNTQVPGSGESRLPVAGAEPSSAPSTAAGPDSNKPNAPLAGGGNNTPTTAGAQPAQPGAGANAQNAAAEQLCADQSNAGPPITIAEIAGFWSDSDTGEVIQIKPTDSGTGLMWIGKTDRKPPWQGNYDSGKLSMSRLPSIDEMGDAPDWAKREVVGKVKWELELEAKRECGQLVLKGKWYPGDYKWAEDSDDSGATRRTVSDIGRGKPLDVKYVTDAATINLLAITETGPIEISRLFYGVPTVIEVVFNRPQSDTTKKVTITVDGKDASRVAERDRDEYRRFRTGIFIPSSSSDSGKPR